MSIKLYKKLLIVITISLTAVIFFVSCYPLSTGAIKWRIKWDKKEVASKKSFLQTQTSCSVIRPNIILIVADDLGLNEVSSYDNTALQTPNIDQLAKDGIRCTDAYVTAPICAPSRCAILTGRYQQRCGFETQPTEFYPENFVEYMLGKKFAQRDSSWVVAGKHDYPFPWQIAKQGMPPTEITIAELLKKQDYATAIIGKWHLGLNEDINIPNKFGFDYQFGIYGSQTLYAESVNAPDIINYEHKSFTSKYMWQMGRKDVAMIYENNKKIKHQPGYLTDVFRDKAIRFIEKNKDRPFFLYLPFTAPHEPYQAPLDLYSEAYVQTHEKGKAVYGAIVRAMDNAIGAVYQKIKDLKLDENTLIIFLSDNGNANYGRVSSCAPLQGGKFTFFQGGVKVPVIYCWKNQLPQNRVYPKSVSALDVFSTIAAATNTTLPNDRVIDGVNLLPYFKQENMTEPHPVLFWKADKMYAVKSGDYKLLMDLQQGWTELYDLKNDPYEKHNISADHPEKTEELRQVILAWSKQLPNRPLWPRIMDYKIKINGKIYYFPV
ncbi:MAG TPA: sulfatase-like hydrolase/transferase [Chitinophagales bacterium]|nr:sulfatase-like hydrolase/transferase [Chitinophagales bacterium]HNL84578.1 sulfatase-like hydrolase/transferase [Chitinophagales bacterium]